MLPEEKKKDLRVQNSTLILGGRGWGRQGKGISISTMQKGAILQKCVNTLVPHCMYLILKYSLIDIFKVVISIIKYSGNLILYQ